MLKLEDLKKDAQVRGLEGDSVVRIVTAEPVGADAANVFYVDANGKPGSQMLFRTDEARLFDPMIAVHTSNAEPSRTKSPLCTSLSCFSIIFLYGHSE